jgi:hypothetical protein
MKVFGANIPDWFIEFACSSYKYFVKSDQPKISDQLLRIDLNADLSKRNPTLSLKTPDLGTVVLQFNEGFRDSEGYLSVKPVKKSYSANGRTHPLHL